MRLHSFLLGIVGSLGVAVRGASAVTIDECVALSLEHAPATRAARADVDASTALVRAARAAYAPRLQLQSEYGRSAGYDRAVTNGGSTAATLGVEATLFDGGLRDAQFAAARARLHSAEALAQQRRADLALSTRVAYFSAIAGQAEAAIHDASVVSLGDYLGLLQRLEVAGAAPRNDVLRGELALQAARSAARDAAAARDTALVDLQSLTGVSLTIPDLREPIASPPASADADNVESSPLLADAHATVEAARRDVDAVRSEWRSHVVVSANTGFVGVVPDTTFQDNAGAAILLGFSMPLYDGGAVSARTAAASAAVAHAEAGVAQARQTINNALAHGLIEVRRAQDEEQAWRRAVPQSAEAYQVARARYLGGGNVRLLEVLDALTQSVEAQLAVVRAQLAYRVTLASHDQILGKVGP